ncbi:MAG: NADH-quinone oxidoreductase subunit NuoE [Candidatus Eisenbacteria bacterium]|uniref:NADH-quinone oxidoreductase subunit NuoE n=1 Tax=Eiseniibacteriota bacterium TaxID=2212470 RepID=A0A948RYS3_UNCEI|nr:NADH-quinone oxidoreductase subunit NuoE [Candidatus Eisenbacteria bacterium]MBU1950298.1 NADH-quinone oxidoreductase subunit NuoE [Candidatus Eisenbacteria bacterium]MBU2692886.1 NADH-quinone oxidoreductase subunit NuoE [Candidatus Eisenbacteria bacterium]
MDKAKPAIGPRLNPELGGTIRPGGANRPGSEGCETPFPMAAAGAKIEFSPETLAELESIIAKYPDRTAALLPALWIAQREFGYISHETIPYLADLIGIPPSQVYGVTSFYTMFQPKPEGRFVISICTNISCALLGADSLVEHLMTRLHIGLGETTPDGLFTLKAVECLACCDGAPAMQVNEETYMNLTKESLDKLLESLKDKGGGRT